MTQGRILVVSSLIIPSVDHRETGRLTAWFPLYSFLRLIIVTQGGILVVSSLIIPRVDHRETGIIYLFFTAHSQRYQPDIN